jgi:two pore calcium channel protein
VVVFSYFQRWKLLSETIVHMIAVTAPILGMLYCICSLFSILGVHLFAGDVYITNPRLPDTQYAASGLWVLNFNDYASATATALNLCVVGNWYIIMEGYAAATGSNWSRVYFILFWFITVAFTLSVVIAYFIEAFTTQMEKAKARERAASEQARKEALLAKSAGVPRQRGANPGHFMIFKKTVSYYNLPPRRQ